PRWWPGTGAEVSRTLFASCGDHESAPAGTGGGAGDLSVERLCPWQPATAHDPRCRCMHPALPPSYLPRRLPAAPPVWVAREPGAPGEARAVPRAAPAGSELHTASV